MRGAAAATPPACVNVDGAAEGSARVWTGGRLDEEEEEEEGPKGK